MKQRTSIFLDDTDKAAIAAIKGRKGITTTTDVIRYSLRLAEQFDGVIDTWVAKHKSNPKKVDNGVDGSNAS